MFMFFKRLLELDTNYWLIFSTGILTYIFIYYGIRKEKGVGQNFCSWMLWVFLDLGLIIPTYQKGGLAPLIMLLSSLLGSFVISLYLYRMGNIRWGKNEKRSLYLVIAIFILWLFSEYGEKPIIGDKNFVIIIGVIAQVIAGWPLTKESYLKPRPIYITGYLFFIISCVLSLTLKKNVFEKVIIEDHLFPIVLGLQTVVDVIPLLKKWWESKYLPTKRRLEEKYFALIIAISLKSILANKKY